jgi:uncharacterized protein
MTEHDIEIRSGEAVLAGTLVLPRGDGPFPAVLFIHGSGPLDRDENMPGQRLDIFNTFAKHFAELGIASLRYDKRGCGRSTGDYHSAGQTEFLADADACLAELVRDPRFSHRLLLGHSEGTIISARLSLERDVAGLVLLTPFVARIEAILMSQASHAEAAMRETKGVSGFIARALIAMGHRPTRGQRKLIDALRSTSESVLRMGGRRIEAKSLRELLELDPAAIYARVRAPMLLVSGEKDVQCDPADANRIAALAGEKAKAIVVPDLTHILRLDPGPPSFAAYPNLIRQPMDPHVLRLVGEWITAQ